MKQFTIKDFMLYNGPCFNCGKKITVNFYQGKNKDTHAYVDRKITSRLDKNIVTFNLKCSYSTTLNIRIDIATHKYVLGWVEWDEKEKSYSDLFNKFNREYSLFLESSCSCGTYVSSNKLQFNDAYIKPLTLYQETLIIKLDDVLYTISSDFKKNESVISVWNKSGSHKRDGFVVPLLPLYKLKTKEKSVEKIKKIILFS